MANLATINDNILADSGIDPINLIVGTGTVNYIPKFTAEGAIGNSIMTESGANILISSNIVLHAGNYNSYAPTLTGGGASGTWGINISGNAATATNADTVDGLHASAFALTGGSNATGTWPINVTGSSGYANSAAVAGLVNGTSGGAIQSWDIRTIAPSSMVAYRMGFGFTSWANNNSAPYADYLHLRSYSDASGGNDNLIMFLKSGFGMRIYQQAWGSSAPYTSYVDMLHSGNYTDFTVTKTGGGASGTWGISITGNADTLDGYHAASFAFADGSNASGTWGINISGNAATVTNGVYTTGSYSNPSWLTALAWSKITGTPTTLAGYGITDAVPSSRTLTINGVGYDLSANRSWTIAAGVTSILAGAGIAVDQNQGDVTISNTGVLSVNGNTGDITGIATTAQLAGYLPLTGGTLTGNLTIANFNNLVLTGVSLKGYTSGQLWFISNDANYAGYVIGTSWDWDRQVELSYSPSATGALSGIFRIGQLQKNSAQWTHGYTTFYFNGADRFTFNYSGEFTATGNVRAPIYYDSVNTNFYLEPRATSILNTVNATNVRVSNAFYWGSGNVYMNYTGRINTNVGFQSEVDMIAPIYYDYNDTAFYGNFASISRFNITRHEGIADTSYVRLVNPGGGYNVNSSPLSAAIKIKIPPAASFQNTMLSFTVKIYNYSTGTSRTICIGGYTYYNQDWYNIFAYQIGDNNAGDLTIRFGKDATGNCVWIGETNTYWSYPNVFITDVQSGHSQPTTMVSGWSISFETSFDTVQDSRVAYSQINAGNIGSQSVNYAANAGNSATTSQTNFTTLTLGGNGVATQAWVNAQGFVTGGPYVPTSRTLTINGVTYDLSANRSWTIATSGVNSIIAGTGIAVDQPQGDVRVSNTGVLSINGSTGDITGVLTTSNYSSTLDSVYLKGTTNPGTPGNFNLSIGYNGSYSYVQSHSAQPLYLNPVGNAVYIGAGNTVLHSGNYNSYAPTLTGGGASGTWGISISGTATYATNLYGLGLIQSTSTGTSYTANYQVRENVGGGGNTNEIYAPQLAFHWSGVVASSIMMESSGRMAIRNNPGTGYEDLIANIVYGSASVRAPIFYDSNDTGYYADLNGTSNLNSLYTYAYRGNGNVDGTGSASYHPSGIYSTGTNWLYGTVYLAGSDIRSAGGFVQNNLVGRPNAQWGAGGSTTGAVVIKFPGGTGNYGMVHAVIDIYEYNGNNVTTVIVGGHNWGSQWYSYGANVVGYTNKQVRVGVKDGQYCIVIGDGSSSWSYGQVVLRKIQNGSYYSGVMDVGAGYTIQIESDTYSWISGDLRTFRSSGNIYMNEALVATQSWVSSQGYVTGGPFLPLAGGTVSGATTFNGNMTWFNGQGSQIALENIGSFARFAFNGLDFYDWQYGISMTISNGDITATGSFRAPIFYDSNDTNYYVDPNSTSVLSYLQLNAVESAGLYGIRGRFTNEYIHLYNKVGIGNPNGWGQGENVTPGFGLSVYGGANFAYGNNALSTFNGQVNIMGSSMYVTASQLHIGKQSSGTAQMSFESWGSYTGAIAMNASGAFSWGGQGASSWYWKTYCTYNGDYSASGNIVLSLNASGSLSAVGDMRAPIFYDSADTSYYLDPNSTSRLYRINSYYLSSATAVSDNHEFGIYFDSGLSTAYAIYRAPGAWTHPYPDLRIAFHTGIQIGANASYQGVRFYTDYDMATQVMSVNNGSDPLGGSNVYVNNSLQAGSSLRAPIFYDSEDTNYYVDPNNTSNLRTTTIFNNYVGNAIYFGGGNNYLNWDGARITSNVGIQSATEMRAPIFYDSNDTNYYVNPAGYSQLKAIGLDAGYVQYATSVGGPTANFGNGRVYLYVWPVASGGRIMSFKISISTTWNWAPAFGYISADVSFYFDGTNLYYPETTITSATGQARNNLGIGQPVLVNGYVAIPIYSTNTNSVFAKLEGSPSFDWSVVSWGSWQSISFPGSAIVNIPGSVTIAGTLGVSGAITASGFFESSDARLKTIVDENYRVDSIVSIKPKFYQKNGKFEAGYIAQEVQEIYSHAVSLGVDGYLSLSYGQIHTLKIAALEDSIDEIKKKIQQLEEKLNTLH